MQTTTTQNFNLYHLLTLSVPVLNKNRSGNTTAITSSIYIEDLFIKKKEFLTRMFYLNLRDMALVLISDETEIDTGNIEVLEENFGTVTCKLTILYFNPEDFFSYSGFAYFFSEHKDKNYEIIYAFKGKTWKELSFLFGTTGVDISGGSNNKKYLLSPHQFRLSQFLSCLYGSHASTIVKESFHRFLGNKDKKIFDYSPKRVQAEITDYVLSNEYLKSQLLKDTSQIYKSFNEFTKARKKELQKTNTISNVTQSENLATPTPTCNKNNNAVDSAAKAQTVTPSHIQK